MKLALSEDVWLDFRPAGYGSRGLAYLVDFVVRWSIIFAIYLLVVTVYFTSASVGDVVSEAFRSKVFGGGESSFYLVLAVVGLVVFFVELLYPVFFEVRYAGVTPGKKLLGLRVVDENGLPVSLQASLLRNLLLLVDLLPGMGLVGLASMLSTERSQRLGDLLARSMVVYEIAEVEKPILLSSPEKTETIDLPLDIYNLLERFLVRRNSLFPENRDRIAARLGGLLEPSLLGKGDPVPKEGEGRLEWVYANAEPSKQSFK